jgi:hypothetical protein
MGQAIECGTPVPLFVARVNSSLQGGQPHQYAVSTDGQRFLINTPTASASRGSRHRDPELEAKS